MKLSFQGFFYATIAGVFYGIIPLLILGITRSGAATSSFCIMMRMLVASLLLLPSCIKRIKKEPIPPRFLKDTLVAAILMSCTSILIFGAYQYIPTGIGITIHYTYPLVIMCASVILFHARVSRRTVFAMLISLLGIVLLCDSSSLSDGAVTGIIMALCSSGTFTAYLLWVEQRRLGDADPIVYTAVMAGLSAMIHLVYNLLTGGIHVTFSMGTVSIFLLTGILGILAVLTQALAVKFAGSVYTSILGTLEPIICTLGSALVLHEHISARTLVGSALTLTAVVLVTLNDRKVSQTHQP